MSVTAPMRLHSRRYRIHAGHGTSAGFTLLELLVALSIFAVMSVMAYSGLRTVLDSRAQTETQAQHLADLQKAMALMQRDVEQIVARGIRDEFGDSQPALVAGQSETSAIEFTHTGWSNPTLASRSDLQRVAYGVRDEELIRSSWTVLDRAQDSQPLEAVILKNVRRFDVRFMNDANEWTTTWPPTVPGPTGTGAGTGNALPKALELTIETDDMGTITRLFPVAGPHGAAVPGAAAPGAASPGSGN